MIAPTRFLMFKKILIGVIAVMAVFVVIVALQPADFRVERSAVISAPAAVVFEKVNNLRTWQEFSPWAKLDPAAKATFEGPESGAGACLPGQATIRWAKAV